MSLHESSHQDDDQASIWAIKIDAGELEPNSAAELDAWLAGNRRRQGALLRAQAALSFLDRGPALRTVLPPLQARLLTRRRMLFAAAGLAALTAGAGVLRVLMSPARRYSTELGELRRVPLADGSVASINTQSVLDVAMEPTVRQVNLARGEAWFQVAKDTSRPFVVAAGRARIRAVGTAFSVRRREQGTDVLVTEGTVETWVVGAEDQKSRLSAGARAFMADYGPPTLAQGTEDIKRALAWRDGQIALQGETLANAAAEFNRYNSRKIVIVDAELARQRLVGQFRTSEPEAFVRAVKTVLGATVAEDAEGIFISRGVSP
jgi:transmembrane sensor